MVTRERLTSSLRALPVLGRALQQTSLVTTFYCNRNGKGSHSSTISECCNSIRFSMTQKTASSASKFDRQSNANCTL